MCMYELKQLEQVPKICMLFVFLTLINKLLIVLFRKVLLKIEFMLAFPPNMLLLFGL